jgi:hypothetical protein
MPWSAAQLDQLIGETTVDAHGESEPQVSLRPAMNAVPWSEDT